MVGNGWWTWWMVVVVGSVKADGMGLGLERKEEGRSVRGGATALACRDDVCSHLPRTLTHPISTPNAWRPQAKARSKLCKTSQSSGPTFESNSGSRSKATDEFYAEFLCLRSVPVSKFLQGAPGQLTITSISEDRLLSALCLPLAERTQIEGLHSLSLRTHAGAGLTEEQLTSRAVFRLTSNPPPEVGKLQRRTSELLLRPFPLGLRVSGKNMSPLYFRSDSNCGLCTRIQF